MLAWIELDHISGQLFLQKFDRLPVYPLTLAFPQGEGIHSVQKKLDSVVPSMRYCSQIWIKMTNARMYALEKK